MKKLSLTINKEFETIDEIATYFGEIIAEIKGSDDPWSVKSEIGLAGDGWDLELLTGGMCRNCGVGGCNGKYSAHGELCECDCHQKKYCTNKEGLCDEDNCKC